MLNCCANAHCGRPLHYLREGRIFVFDVAGRKTAAGGGRSSHLEHYWLCGECSRTATLTQDATGKVTMAPRVPDDFMRDDPFTPEAA
jgi:hypothetical protein